MGQQKSNLISGKVIKIDYEKDRKVKKTIRLSR